MYPSLQRDRVVIVTARDDKPELGSGGEWLVLQIIPMTGTKRRFGQEHSVVCEFGSVVENTEGEIALQREQLDGLRDAA